MANRNVSEFPIRIMPMSFGRRVASYGLLLAFAVATLSAASKWETLENVRLVKGGYSDGDSIRAEHNGKEYTFRIFYVDAPETTDNYPKRLRGQARAFGISAARALELGAEAAEFTRRFLESPFTVHTDWSDGWGQQTRYRAIIERNGRDLAAELVRNGLARVSGFVPDTPWPDLTGSVWEYRDDLKKLQERARLNGRGGWARSRSSRAATGASPPAGTQDLPDLNTVDKGRLMALPGIGAVLAGRIIELRPFRSIEELEQVYGISSKTIEVLRPVATVVPPPLFPNTADYFRQNARYYVNAPVRVTVSALRLLDDPAPEGFAVAVAETIHPDGRGGSMRLFAPKAKMATARARFDSTGDPLDVRAWLRDLEGEIILVVY